MTRIRDFIVSLRAKRAQRLRSDSENVSFDSFWSEIQTSETVNKESEFNSPSFGSPEKINKKTESLMHLGVSNKSNPRSSRYIPDCYNVWFIVFLVLIFLVLPIVYLTYCSTLVSAPVDENYNTIKSDTHIKVDKKQPVPNRIVSNANEPPIRDSDSMASPNQDGPEAAPPVAPPPPPPPKPDAASCAKVGETDRFDCYPEDDVTQDKCLRRGCCWKPAKKDSENERRSSGNPLDTPYCYYPANYRPYKYVNVTYTAFGLVAYMKQQFLGPYGDDVPVLRMEVKYETDTRLRVKITDPSHNRYEPPYPEVPIVDKAAANTSYRFVIDNLRSGFKVVRKLNNATIFDTMDVGGFFFSDKFIQLSAKLPSNLIYGLGEHRSSLLLSTRWQRFTMFNHDGIPDIDKNLYGTHPFYLAMENDGKGTSHGVFLLNSNAMDVILQPTPAITFRPIGGVLDLYFLLGPSPADVVVQYTDVVGRPFLPPYWGLGFHLCRFGYKTVNDTKTVLMRNRRAGVPIDVQWNDLDYMDSENDFTYDQINYKGLPQFVQELHKDGLHYVVIVDPGVSASEPPGTYPPYDRGIEMDVFVKNSTDQVFVGKVWNKGTTVWPDFTSPRTVDYWTSMLTHMHKQFNFDGAWIDMNEPSNFLNGQAFGLECPNDIKPAYMPHVEGNLLSFKTMCMNAKHATGRHYDLHNLFGFTEAIVTSFAMAEIRGTRPFVISRATFPGHGHYAGHWSGDVRSRWTDMKYSIPQLLSFSLFGIPLMGADICGFNENTTEPLCNRWMQLGAFYPFSRNHNTDDGIPQDPVSMGPQVVASSIRALNIRYSLLPYLYTLFWGAHTRGDTVVRPLFFDFPHDGATYPIDEQFLWGSALMIIPVLKENATTVKAYLPEGIWYDYYSRKSIPGKQTVEFAAPLDTIPLVIRGGNIIPMQSPANNTRDARKTPVELLAASDSDGNACGEFYWDDGDSLNCVEEKKYTLVNFRMEKSQLFIKTLWFGPEPEMQPPLLGQISILGLNKPITQVTVNQVSQNFKYDTIHKVLVIKDLNVSFKSNITVSWK